MDPAATPRTARERIGLTGNLASISMPGDSGAEVTPRPVQFSDSGSDSGARLGGVPPAHLPVLPLACSFLAPLFVLCHPRAEALLHPVQFARCSFDTV